MPAFFGSAPDNSSDRIALFALRQWTCGSAGNCNGAFACERVDLTHSKLAIPEHRGSKVENVFLNALKLAELDQRYEQVARKPSFGQLLRRLNHVVIPKNLVVAEPLFKDVQSLRHQRGFVRWEIVLLQ